MRTTLALLLLGLSALAMATVHTNKYGKEYKVADKAFLEKQKDVLRLFKYIFQHSYYHDQVEIAKSYKIEEHLDHYTNQKAVKEFLHYWKEGFLPRGQVFSVFYEHQKDEVVSLFNVFYYAKDWETFYKTACWAREYVNEGMFVYAMHAAVLHRHDTEGMVLPPIYEIYPYFFVNSEVIDKAYEYKMKYGGEKDHDKVFYVNANYSGWYLNANPTQKDMGYFYEDVGLNSWYYYFNLDYPFWLGGEEFGLSKDRRGELFYFVHQQLLARYYMERLSNDHGTIHVFDWEEPIKTGYVPSMRYPNGLEFPVRPAYSHLVYNPHNQPFTYYGHDNVFEIHEIEDYERRIRTAIDSGFIFTEDGHKIDIYKKDGFEWLGKIMEGSVDSPNRRFYGVLQVLAHQVLGYGPHPVTDYKVVPGAMEQFETCLRDPVFYQFYKRITYYFLQYKNNLPTYTYDELKYPGVKIEDVHFDKLVTYFDHFDFDITNALYVTEREFQEDSFHVRARQMRLNHKPFTYKMDVMSDKDHDVLVRVFMGPKYHNGHHMCFKDNWFNFVQFDKFPWHLKAGKNVIERHSYDSKYTVKDRTTWRQLYQHVMAALKGEEEFHLDMTEAHTGFPNRFILPKGTVSGQEYEFFFYIGPYTPTTEKLTYDKVISAGIGSGQRYYDDMPFGYPLDRPMKNEQTFFVPNSYMEDVTIFHKTETELNMPHH